MINSSSSPASIVGPIIGGALGGFFGLIGIVFLIWWLWNKRRKFLPASLMSEKSPQSSHPGLPTGYVVEPQQYQYGHVGSSFSHGSTPHSVYARSSQSHSNSQSHAHSVAHSGTPPLVAGTASQRASFRQNSSPTPPFFAATAFAPGLSAGPSSANLHSPPAPSTPGHVFQNPPPSSFPARPSRSGYGNGTDDEQSSEGHGSITFLSRRPSRRLSPGVERRVGPQPPESRPPLSFENRSTPPFERTGPLPKSRNSFSERIEIDRPLRPVFRRRSTDATPYEEPGSPLFVVNHTEEPSGSDAEPDKPTSSPG
ncbi:hypothetical protein BC835DRAFT_472036 [Cytidiella melzeri]|nr:hypothetical protein BC835DRAFT_472036 [Cytidiella melzeri]